MIFITHTKIGWKRLPRKSRGRNAPGCAIHDESNCFVHAQLHLARMPVAWVPLLILLGLFVAFLTQIASPLVSQRQIFRIDCRGPPLVA